MSYLTSNVSAVAPGRAMKSPEMPAAPVDQTFTRAKKASGAEKHEIAAPDANGWGRQPSRAGFLRGGHQASPNALHAGNAQHPIPPSERPDSHELAFLRRNAHYLIDKMNATGRLFQYGGMPFATARNERGNVFVDPQGILTISVNDRPLVKFFNDAYDQTNTHIMMADSYNNMRAGRDLPLGSVFEANDLVNSALNGLLQRRMF